MIGQREILFRSVVGVVGVVGEFQISQLKQIANRITERACHRVLLAPACCCSVLPENQR